MVVDMDEFVYHPDLLKYLGTMTLRKHNVLVPLGFDMVGDQLPVHGTPITEQIRTGYVNYAYTKPLIFNPEKFDYVNFTPGSHTMRPRPGPTVVDTDKNLKLLHYHWLSKQWVIDRNVWRNSRLSALNKKNRWGLHYTESEQRVSQTYDDLRAKCLPDVFTVEFCSAEQRAHRLARRRTIRR
jgi:hypothetical protein